MRIAGIYSFNDGEKYIKCNFPQGLREIEGVIKSIYAYKHKKKKSKEKTMKGKMLYSPSSLNRRFKEEFELLGWYSKKIKCEYSSEYYVEGYIPEIFRRGAYREIDFIKNKLAVEVQFGKYSFMVYNVCAKMTIFKKLGFIDAGVEIVPVKHFAREMSSGVSYFEQIVWDLEHRGVADIDIPIVVLGIDMISGNSSKLK